MRERRRRGAFCLVAALEESATAPAAAAAAADRGAVSGREKEGGGSDGDVDVDVGVGVGVVKTGEVSHDHVLGTLECSRHEFDGTPLEVQVEEGGAKIARWDGTQAGRPVRGQTSLAAYRSFSLSTAADGLTSNPARSSSLYVPNCNSASNFRRVEWLVFHHHSTFTPHL